MQILLQAVGQRGVDIEIKTALFTMTFHFMADALHISRACRTINEIEPRNSAVFRDRNDITWLVGVSRGGSFGVHRLQSQDMMI